MQMVSQAYCGKTNKMQVNPNTAPGIQSIHLYICTNGFVMLHSKILFFADFFLFSCESIEINAVAKLLKFKTESL